MAWLALALLAAGVGLMATLGWPSYAVLLAVSAAIAVVGALSGAIDAGLLLALAPRLVGILEHDLLQAIALYALVGALLQHGTVVAASVAALERLLALLHVPTRSRQLLGGMLAGFAVAPLNGAVAANVAMLSGTVVPRWQRLSLPAPRLLALTSVTATLGVVVPPSLVLLLLGDALLRAHTEGLQLGRIVGVRVVNTQDLVQAILPAAAALALAWLLLAAWRGERTELIDTKPSPQREEAAQPGMDPRTQAEGLASTATTPARPGLAGWLAPLAVALLLWGVASGWLRAVEAAATAALALWLHGLWTGALRADRLQAVLSDAMALSGALFALLLAASTLGLMLRASGCDLLVAQALSHAKQQPELAVVAVLGLLLLMAFVLDAIELIFLVIPIVFPPLLALGVDAAWLACLTLLVLQAGFLLPPWGYALVLSRARLKLEGPSTAQVAKELAPFLAALAAVIALLAAFPQVTHWLRTAPEQLEQGSPVGVDVDELLRRMGPPPERSE